jgi:hypothetical protein
MNTFAWSFDRWLRCSLVTDRNGYAPRSRLASGQNPGAPGVHFILNSLLCALPIPPGWPQFGIELTAGWARRGWQGAIAHTRRLRTKATALANSGAAPIAKPTKHQSTV